MNTQTHRGRPFLIAIGIFYLANLLGTLHSSSLFGMMYSGVDLQVGAPVFTLLQDAWAAVGLQLGAIGLVALWGARQPSRFMAVVPVVIVTEALDGIWDFYSIMWSHEAMWFGLLTLAIHVVWIVWGLQVWRVSSRP
ncbi:BphX family protein [Dyella ginsengisoli]|uniref:Membrane protein of biphenyl pathway n=1 Tax=Dyella ginsengisoli TaxID=363848 RepID=B6CLA8_9GAMM|nr:BphX family protein [Dyella ginsengisoli]ACI42910.1 membrane protein of biphenyl pathway [Dyella ginsengisoli LA-4]